MTCIIREFDNLATVSNHRKVSYNLSIMTETRDAEIHHLIGGVLCLDFANTLYGHAEAIHEYLFDYRDLVLWSRHTEILSPEKVTILLSKEEQAPAKSEAVFHQAIQIRETIFRVFADLARDETPQNNDLIQLHQVWLENQSHTRLEQSDTGFELGWEDGDALDAMLWPITRSAVELLTSDELNRVKQCGRCDWLFVDRSRNQSRRWCSMDACGNRIKMARRYEREKRGT
jgi:predicted RNA-binding Zn ribbon-like protein